MSYNAYRKKDQAIDPAQAMQRARGKFSYISIKFTLYFINFILLFGDFKFNF